MTNSIITMPIRLARLLALVVFLAVATATPLRAEEKSIPTVLRDESAWLPVGARVEANVVLIHGVMAGSDTWKQWVGYARERHLAPVGPSASGRALDGENRPSRIFPYRVWTYGYNWDHIANTAARSLALEMQKDANRAKFAGVGLVLVGHSKGGLVAKAFAWRLMTRDRDFPTPEALGIRADQLRIVYLDVPHGGGNFVNNPFLRLVIATLAALSHGALFANLGAAEELARGYNHDPGLGVPSYSVVPLRAIKNRDIEVHLKLLGLEHLFGVARPMFAPVVPYTSSMRTTTRYTFTLDHTWLDVANQEMRGAIPSARYVYHDWHGSVARSRRVFDLVFQQIVPGRIASVTKALEPPTLPRASVDKAFQAVLGRSPSEAERAEADGKSLDGLRSELAASVEGMAKSIPQGDRLTEAWRRHGCEAVLGQPQQRAVEVPPGSGRWILWLNPPDSSVAALCMSPASAGRACLVRGPIAIRYFSAADFATRHGFPTAEEANGRQPFERGDIVVKAGSDTAEFQPR